MTGRGAGSEDDEKRRLAIQFFDHHFMLGYFYISVLGTKNAFQSCCEYELRWDCRKVRESELEADCSDADVSCNRL